MNDEFIKMIYLLKIKHLPDGKKTSALHIDHFGHLFFFCHIQPALPHSSFIIHHSSFSNLGFFRPQTHQSPRGAYAAAGDDGFFQTQY
jgi:hypothetical protein